MYPGQVILCRVKELAFTFGNQLRMIGSLESALSKIDVVPPMQQAERCTMAGNQEANLTERPAQGVGRAVLPGFTVERGSSGKIKSVWIELKNGRQSFKTKRDASVWISQNPNYLDEVKHDTSDDS